MAARSIEKCWIYGDLHDGRAIASAPTVAQRDVRPDPPAIRRGEGEDQLALPAGRASRSLDLSFEDPGPYQGAQTRDVPDLRGGQSVQRVSVSKEHRPRHERRTEQEADYEADIAFF